MPSCPVFLPLSTTTPPLSLNVTPIYIHLDSERPLYYLQALRLTPLGLPAARRLRPHPCPSSRPRLQLQVLRWAPERKRSLAFGCWCYGIDRTLGKRNRTLTGSTAVSLFLLRSAISNVFLSGWFLQPGACLNSTFNRHNYNTSIQNQRPHKYKQHCSKQ